MSMVKTLRFPAHARWFGGRLLRLDAAEKSALAVAAPTELEDGVAGSWSPEELLVGSLAAGYELALVSLAERNGIPLHTLEVRAEGELEYAPIVGYSITELELDVELTTDPGRELDAEEVAALAKHHCIVGNALGVPVRIRRVDAQAVNFAVDAAA